MTNPTTNTPTNDPPKTFTQEELNALLKKERTSSERRASERIAELQGELDQHKTLKAELIAKVEELTKANEQLTSEASTLRTQAEQSNAQSVELTRKRDEAITGLRASIASMQLTNELLSANAAPKALQAALRVMLLDVEIEQDDQGKVTALTHDGQRYDKVSEGVRAFVNSHLYFKSGTQGGSGAVRPGSGGGGTSARALRTIEGQDPAALADAGWQDPPQ